MNWDQHTALTGLHTYKPYKATQGWLGWTQLSPHLGSWCYCSRT